MSKTRRAISLKFCIRNAFMDIMTHAKFHLNWLMLTLIFGIRSSEPPPPPLGLAKRLKRPGLIGLNCCIISAISGPKKIRRFSALLLAVRPIMLPWPLTCLLFFFVSLVNRYTREILFRTVNDKFSSNKVSQNIWVSP